MLIYDSGQSAENRNSARNRWVVLAVQAGAESA